MNTQKDLSGKFKGGWRKIKDAHSDDLLLIRVGEYYETFFQDAEKLAQITELNLYTLDYGRICGFKWELLDGIRMILDKGEIKYQVIEDYKIYE